jgi:hypothetical protein
MSDDRLPVRTLFGSIGGHTPPVALLKLSIEYTRDDLLHLSELHGVRGKLGVGVQR